MVRTSPIMKGFHKIGFYNTEEELPIPAEEEGVIPILKLACLWRRVHMESQDIPEFFLRFGMEVFSLMKGKEQV